MSGELDWRAADEVDADDLAEAWLVVVGSGDVARDDAVRADAAGRPGVVRRRGGVAAGTATLPPTARVTTPDGPVTVATHAPGDRALAAHVTATGSASSLATGSLDLRRRTARPGAGWVALVGGGPGRRRPPHEPGPRAARRGRRRRRSTGSPRTRWSTGCPPRCASSTSARPPAGTPWRRSGSTTSSSRRPSPATRSCASRAVTPTCSGAEARSAWRARRTASGSRSCPA